MTQATRCWIGPTHTAARRLRRDARPTAHPRDTTGMGTGVQTGGHRQVRDGCDSWRFRQVQTHHLDTVQQHLHREREPTAVSVWGVVVSCFQLRSVSCESDSTPRPCRQALYTPIGDATRQMALHTGHSRLLRPEGCHPKPPPTEAQQRHVQRRDNPCRHGAAPRDDDADRNPKRKP